MSGLPRQIGHTFPVEANALVEPHEIERIFDVERLQDVVGRKVLDTDQKIAAELPEVVGQPLPGRFRQQLDVRKAW